MTRGYRVFREASGEAERSREGKCIQTSRGSAAKTIRLIQQQNGNVSRRRRTQIKQLLDQWLSGKLSTGSRVQSFPRAFPSSNEVSVLLLNQPKHRQHSHSNPVSYSGYFQQNVMNYTVLEKNWYFFICFFSCCSFMTQHFVFRSGFESLRRETLGTDSVVRHARLLPDSSKQVRCVTTKITTPKISHLSSLNVT